MASDRPVVPAQLQPAQPRPRDCYDYFCQSCLRDTTNCCWMLCKYGVGLLILFSCILLVSAFFQQIMVRIGTVQATENIMLPIFLAIVLSVVLAAVQHFQQAAPANPAITPARVISPLVLGKESTTPTTIYQAISTPTESRSSLTKSS